MSAVLTLNAPEPVPDNKRTDDEIGNVLIEIQKTDQKVITSPYKFQNRCSFPPQRLQLVQTSTSVTLQQLKASYAL